MAFSQPLTSSLRKGQMAIVCQLCENDPKLQWKCLECRLMMCQKCRDKVHAKFASAEDHTIIDIKDIHKHPEEEPKTNFTKLKCSEHAGQYSCLYCKLCSDIVCPICVSKTHNKHDLIEISEGYKIHLEKIKDEQKNVQEGIKKLSHVEEELRKIKFLEESRYKESKEGILEYKQSLINAIEKHCDELESELDQKWSDLSKSMTDEEHRVKDTMETLIKQNDEVNSLYQSKDAMKVFSSQSLLKSMETNIQVKTNFDHVPKFVPGDVTKVSLLHGKLEKVTPSYNKDLTVVQQFQTECEDIHNLILYPNDSFWINDGSLKMIQKVSSNRGNLQVKCELNLVVNDMLLTPSGDLLLCVGGSSVLKVIPSGTEEVKDSVYSVSPLIPASVHVTKDNKVIIGAIDTGPAIPATGPRQVIILDQSGQQEKVFQFDSNNEALFTLPRYITSNSSNNIGVVDRLSVDIKGRVVILDQYGGVKHIYSGLRRINRDDNPFKPRRIITTPADNFIITDVTNHTLHILSSEGEIITYFNTKELGIELPIALSFSHTGQLYIGCGTDTDSDDKAMIYKIDNFVW